MPTFSLPQFTTPSLSIKLPSITGIGLPQPSGFQIPNQPASPFLNTDDTPIEVVPITPPLKQQWGVFDMAGNSVFSTFGPGGAPGNIDTFISLSYSNNAKVSDFPVEQGSFASYNKTGTPFSPKVAVAVAGQSRMEALMQQLEDELNSINLYQLITPERVYSPVTLEKYDYARAVKAGKNMLHVTMIFKQVIEITPNQYSQSAITHAKKPAANDKENHGKETTTDAATLKKMAINAARIRAGFKPGTPGMYDTTTWKLIIK
jgi:hypothetical protein